MSARTGHDPAERVRASVATTKAERTARLRYAANFVRLGLDLTDALATRNPGAADVLRTAGGIMRRVAAALPVSTTTGPDGRIDFDNERSLYSAAGFWKLRARGREYIGEPGEWELEEIDALADDDPLWLLALLEATVEATARGTETVLGIACQRYEAIVDFRQVRATADWPTVPPFHARDTTPFRDPQIDISRLPVDVWLDDSGRICRAILYGGSDSMTQIDLSGFGEPDPIELPGPGEILPDEDEPPPAP